MSPSPSSSAGAVTASGPLDPGWITAASASILALALGLAVIVFVVWTPPSGWVRAAVYGSSLGIVALAMVLTYYQATKPTPAVLLACYRTVDELSAYVNAKIIFVETADQAKTLGGQMKDLIDKSACKPS